MSASNHWVRVRRVLEDIIDWTPEERTAYLAGHINEPEIRDEVESLLQAHDSAGDFLEATPTFGSYCAPSASRSPAVLQPGTRVGSFEILAAAGLGGMGQVYRARDTRLDRIVALKIIAPNLANDPSSRERFEREARAISKLTHPHICVLYDVGVAAFGEHGERQFLVMELVEGQTLRERLEEGALPINQALRYGIQIADALAAAHHQKIVHHDLKPANIVLTKSGVKLVDFGLAAFIHQDSPLMGNDASATGIGVIAGTLPYMAPEQLRGRDVDARSDIFSFGAVLYEMVTGRRAFEGENHASLTSAILSTPYPSGTVRPASLDAVVETCLAKESDRRWSNMHDVALQLQRIFHEVTGPAFSRTGVTEPGKLGRWRRIAPWTLAAAFGVAWIVTLGQWTRAKSTPTVSTQRLSVELGVKGSLAMTDASIALSPDGLLLAFVARGDSNIPILYVRRLAQLTATPLNGTAGASSPCFSPDGQWVGFFADSKLKKVPVTGGAVVTLADAPSPRGMSWTEDGSIVFAPDKRMALVRVSSVGGPVQPLTTLANGEITHRFPQVLPGGMGVLYTASTEVNIGTGSTVMVQPLPSGTPRVVQRDAYFGRYVPSGHIVYLQDDTLFAVPFDAKRLEVTGPAGRTLDSVESDASRGSGQVAVSQVGTMVYIQGRNKFDARPIAWMDRTGTLTTLRAQAAEWKNPAFSPDGRRIAIDMRTGGQSDIFVYDWDRDTLTRVTFENTNEEFPVWTPDGTRIIYRSFKSATDSSGYTIAWKRADEIGDAQALVHATVPLRPGSWHPTMNVLAYEASVARNNDDLMLLPVEGDEVHGWKPTRPTPWMNSPARERAPAFSPDGKWLAYSSNESGEDQVYVRPYPGQGPRVMVSNAGGESSLWSQARSELVFASPAFDYFQVLTVAPYRVEHNSFRVEKPRPWAERGVPLRMVLGDRSFALHPDGARVAIAPPSERETATRVHLTFVSNLFEHLRAVAPPQ